MIALDTNVLLRFLVDLDPDQTRKAAAFIRAAVERDEQLFVADVVMCELVWVLDSVLELPRESVIQQLRRALSSRELVFRDSAALASAMDSFATTRGDFADFVIAAQARDAGCSGVATFDKALQKLPGFVAV